MILSKFAAFLIMDSLKKCKNLMWKKCRKEINSCNTFFIKKKIITEYYYHPIYNQWRKLFKNFIIL